MSTPRKTNAIRVRLAVLLSVGAIIGTVPAQAQTVTEDEIASSLRLPQKTRSLSIGAPAASVDEGGSFLTSLRSTTNKPISAHDREKLSAIVGGKPSIDLNIPFAINSATFTPEALVELKKLGTVLSKPEFREGLYVIAGHTDAKGSDAINQSLSERRAEAVRRYLVETHGLKGDHLISVGYGKSRLLDEKDPFASANRRVQATNVSETKSASR
ncbi:OmpA family protein [Methylobacterium sp. Leaf93]|uniref:OmpA family protein n=1 Tax=Methylobacterium sp. Leaf93 TaxID=1736249 RepID=UPI000701CCB6|nr:OmpA family protein [Methylobacterium sp. Leaf93]KQP00979.1 hypothetical protein ASF26_15540 [Methylobacterium sp. Leaf93]